MLCPEVLNFHTPESKLEFFEDITKENSVLSKNIQNFYYNHLVTLIVPDALKISHAVRGCLLEDTEYYKISKLSLEHLITPDFYVSFIKSGTLTSLSIETRVDCDNCVAITPSGQLVLSLTKDTYQKLGLSGKLVKNSRDKLQEHYVVTIDLHTLHGSQKVYERTRERLRTLGEFTVILYWQPLDSGVCPSSIAKYLHDLKCEVQECRVNSTSEIFYSVPVPTVDSKVFREDGQFRCEFLEWLGYLSVCGNNIEQDETVSDYLSSYEIPEPNEVVGQVRMLQFKGFISNSKVETLLKRLMDYTKKKEKQWVAMYVEGFSDCATKWLRNEELHNSYVVLLKENERFLCINK